MDERIPTRPPVPPAELTRRHIARISLFVLVLVLLTLAGVGAEMVRTLRFLRIITVDMGTRPPAFSRMFLAVGPAGWCAILGGLGVALIVKEIVVPQAWVRLAINALAFPVAIVLLEASRHALLSLMVGLLEPLQQ